MYSKCQMQFNAFNNRFEFSCALPNTVFFFVLFAEKNEQKCACMRASGRVCALNECICIINLNYGLCILLN